ncbi:5-formyltetrahydrofolate cyclo-ligase [Nibrella saemangeumensis]|uniref:5-formyltetrahydrofolate cyclo-ligase n=1 Tax=Nibrella saemangeumensis TaxID=1084526 RepID=A0ABP8NNB5_9BACT
MYKAELRKLYRTKRLALSEAEWQQRCTAIQERLLTFFNERFSPDTPLTLHTFLPIRRQREVDTYPIIAELRQRYSKLRVLISRSNPDGSMTHIVWSGHETLTENKWGIPEPAAIKLAEVNSTAIDIVLVPLLIFDKQGNRVGYGKGYYDRFLTTCRPDVLTIGLSLYEPVEAIFDKTSLDVPVYVCFTPFANWYFFNHL